MAWWGVAWWKVAWFDVVWCDVAWCGVAWGGLVLCGAFCLEWGVPEEEPPWTEECGDVGHRSPRIREVLKHLFWVGWDGEVRSERMEWDGVVAGHGVWRCEVGWER